MIEREEPHTPEGQAVVAHSDRRVRSAAAVVAEKMQGFRVSGKCS